MDQEFNIDQAPFESVPEYDSELFEEEIRRRGRPPVRSRQKTRSRPGTASLHHRPPTTKARPDVFKPHHPWMGRKRTHAMPVPFEAGGSERVRWIQDCLNYIQGLRLPVSGFIGPEVRSAVRNFQRREGLRVSGYVGPDTMAALQQACRKSRPDEQSPEEQSEVAWPAEISFNAAINHARANGPGIYTLYHKGRRFYVGKSQNLKRRLQQHLWCLTHMNVSPASYKVKLTPIQRSPDKLAKVESAVIAKWKRKRDGGVLTNVKKELLEQELWGNEWN
jgi:predicted GIY-YIG superfamily endonuclease